MRNVSVSGILLLKNFEGFRLYPYPDPPGQTNNYSIYYGHQIQPGETFNNTTDEGEIIFRDDLYHAAEVVDNNVTADISQTMFDALVSYAYNIGEGNFISSNLLKLVNSGATQQQIKDWWLNHWTGGNNAKRRENEYEFAYSSAPPDPGEATDNTELIVGISLLSLLTVISLTSKS